MNKRSLIITVLALALIITAGISSTLGYFTAVDTAKGTVKINLGDKSDIYEEFDKDALEKLVTIENTGKQPVFVRVQAFTGSAVTVSYTGDNWTKGDGDFWYYKFPLAPGEKTADILKIRITFPGGTVSDDFDLYNVAVIQEYTPVVYDEDGNATANWDAKSTEGES